MFGVERNEKSYINTCIFFNKLQQIQRTLVYLMCVLICSYMCVCLSICICLCVCADVYICTCVCLSVVVCTCTFCAIVFHSVLIELLFPSELLACQFLFFDLVILRSRMYASASRVLRFLTATNAVYLAFVWILKLQTCIFILSMEIALSFSHSHTP